MKLLRGVRFIPELAQGTVATIGNFDGVHQGHQALLTELRQQALRLQLPSLVVLFEPQPSEFFLQNQAPARLTRLREKLQLLKDNKIDYVYCLHFNHKLAQMSALQFAEDIIFGLLCTKFLLIGHDFRFGRDRQGNVALLSGLSAQFQAKIACFDDFSVAGARVSSTAVRQALAASEFAHASRLLGRPFSMCGRVVHGLELGRQWGFPTINLNLRHCVPPIRGIFCVEVQRINKPRLQGVASLGTRPTVDGSRMLLEVHLFDFNELIYGEWVQVFFLHKLRDEAKFDTVNALIAQIKADVDSARAYFLQRVIA